MSCALYANVYHKTIDANSKGSLLHSFNVKCIVAADAATAVCACCVLCTGVCKCAFILHKN